MSDFDWRDIQRIEQTSGLEKKLTAANAEIARLREERLTPEERDAVSGIALVLDRLKLYPEQVGRTKQDDIDLLWRIAEVGRG